MKITKRTSFRSGRVPSHVMHILVWLVAVACVVALFFNRRQQFEVLGIAQGKVCQISATCTGRLKDIPVELFDKVRRGDPLVIIDVVLDNENIEAELRVISAEIECLTAELTATEDGLFAEASERENDKIVAQRRFYVDVENVRLGILELKTQLETDQIVLEDLGREVKITQGLADQKAVVPYEVQKLEGKYNVLAKQIEENKHLLVQTEQNLQHAQQRRDEFAQRQLQHRSVKDALEVIRKAIKVQEQQMDRLTARRQVLVLRSPIDGIVSQIQAGSEDTVLAGEPILTVIELAPTEILAYADETQIGQLKERMVVKLAKNSVPMQIANSQIVHLGSTVELMPQRLWRNSNVAQWGRPILIKIPPGLKLLPGETVGIKGL